MPLEEKMVRFAAPTLAGYKVSNLMNLPKYICPYQDLFHCRQCLASAGIDLCVLLEREVRRLILVYRRSALKEALNEDNIQSFLSTYGYTNFSISASLDQLKTHLEMQDGFPHEIGVFLGYPLSDVEGFIAHKGKDAKLTGYWKVYDNEEEAQKTFSLYAHCQKELCAKYRQGAGLSELSAVG